MPEGHTLHRLALDLNDAFAGRDVHLTSPQGRFADSARLLDGVRFEHAEAHGKNLFLGFGSDTQLHVHLGLIGTFRFVGYVDARPPEPQGQIRVRVATDDPGRPGGGVLADLRGPQTCRLITGAERQTIMDQLGPDPLRGDADPDIGWRRVHRSGKSIGALLMDQKVLSGVGNVYRAEVLFRNRISPFRPGKLLSRRRWQEIWLDLTQVMPEGVRLNRIDTVRTEHTPEAMDRAPRVDDHGGEVYVYRRNGLPCYVCGSLVQARVLEGRNLFWCGRCQRRG